MHPKLFDYFCLCDSGSYLAKAEFYKLKKEILQSEGVADGWDLRIIEKKIKLGPRHDKHYLLRYILHGRVFHLSANKRPGGNPKNIIKGITHTLTDLYAVYRALLILFLNYHPDWILEIEDNTIIQKLLRGIDGLRSEIIDYKKVVNQ